MQGRRLTIEILKPSAFSAIFSLITSVVLLAGANWVYVLHTFLFYDYFFGPDGLITAVRSSGGEPEGFSFGDAFFSQSLMNNLIILASAFLVGFIVFIILEGLQHVQRSRAQLPKKESRQRIGARLMILILWVIYLQISIKIVLPFCVLAAQVGIKSMWGWQGFAYLLFGVGLSCACLHLHVIFARLFLFRIRVFGSSQALLEAERHI